MASEFLYRKIGLIYKSQLDDMSLSDFTKHNAVLFN